MRVELDKLEHNNPPLTRDFHGSCVVIKVSLVYCASRVSGLSRDAKYQNPKAMFGKRDRGGLN